MSTYVVPERGKTLRIDQLDAPSFLKEHLSFLLTVENLAQRTVNSYYVGLRWFVRWADAKYKGDSIEPEAIKNREIKNASFECVEILTTPDIYEFLTYIDNALGNSASSRSARLSALRSFYRYYTVQTHRLQNDPVKEIPSPKLEKRLPKYLTQAEAIQLLKAVESSPRDYCIMTLFLNCGMRLSELVSIDVGDIRDDGSLRIFGKGRKERIVYLNNACISSLNRYLPKRKEMIGSKKTKALFVSSGGERISARRIEQITDDALLKAGLPRSEFSPHKLRHTAATLMYQSESADLLQLQQILGHANVGTTQIYAHVGDEQTRSAMMNSPLANLDSSEGETTENAES